MIHIDLPSYHIRKVSDMTWNITSAVMLEESKAPIDYFCKGSTGRNSRLERHLMASDEITGIQIDSQIIQEVDYCILLPKPAS